MQIKRLNEFSSSPPCFFFFLCVHVLVVMKNSWWHFRCLWDLVVARFISSLLSPYDRFYLFSNTSLAGVASKPTVANQCPIVFFQSLVSCSWRSVPFSAYASGLSTFWLVWRHSGIFGMRSTGRYIFPRVYRLIRVVIHAFVELRLFR